MTATMAYQRSPMTTFIPWICVALIFSASIQGVKSNDVEINPTGSVVVREGDPLKIMCRVGPKIKSCRVAIPNEGSMILSKEDAFTGNIEYDGLGTQAGECGVKILRVKDSYDGDFHCFVTTYESRVETNASVTIVVAKPPQRPEIHLNPAPPAEGYTFGQEVEIICLARWGRPAANLSMYLDDEPIDYSSKLKYYGSNSMKNATTIERNVTRKLDWTDHGKVIRCVADHIALDHPMESKRELNVIFAPRHEDIPKQFGYVIGRRGIVNVTVYANPKPTFVWKIGGVEIPEHRSDEENRLQTSSAVDLGKGAWVVQLTIDPVQKSDTEKEYILEARNVRGMYAYRIFLSTSAEPAGVDLDAGSIIGIAVGALVLILIVFLIIFARATGRWCFAARRRSDEETAGAAGAGSEAHITPGDGDDDDEDPHIMDEKLPHGGQENPIHASTEYVNGRTDIKDVRGKDEKVDTPV